MKKVLLYVFVGLFLVAFGFLAGSFWITVKLAGVPIFDGNETETSAEYSSSESFFWETKYFGGNLGQWDSFKPPPRGKGRLVGKLTYVGTPAKNVRLRVILNSKYKTHLITTNEDGLFTVPLPIGKWHINTIQCERWDNKPEGNFILISGEESKLTKGHFQKLFFEYSPIGKEVVINEQTPEKPHIVLSINPRIKITWPEERRHKQGATITDSVIRWEPYPDAENYIIQIDRVTRESATTTSYSPIAYKRVPRDNILPLANLVHVQDPTAQEEYVVTVRAYGHQKEFLSASQHFSGSFLLKDGNVLVETKDFSEVGIDGSDNDIEEIYLSGKLLDAAEVLIRENMLSAAEKLLDKTVHIQNEGKRLLLLGYLHAAQGDCSQASEYFKSALESGESCVPDSYKANCN